MKKKAANGYFVLKQEDCENYLTTTEQNILWELQKKILASRQLEGKDIKCKYWVVDRNDVKIQEIERLLCEMKSVIVDFEQEA